MFNKQLSREPWDKITDLILEAANDGHRRKNDTHVWIGVQGKKYEYSIIVSFGYCVEWRNETTYDYEAIHLAHSIGRNGLKGAPDDLINAIIEDLPNILDKIRREGVNSRNQLQEQDKQKKERIIATCKKKNKQYEAINQYGPDGKSTGRGLILGERRIIEKFLLLPKTIKGKTRWLGYVKIIQRVGQKEDISGHFQFHWYDEMWVDD